MPEASLSTREARALLPDHYSRADAVANVQNTALLVAAFTLGRGDLLAAAMQDRLHQPYRAQRCPLLSALAPMAGHEGVLGVALSGAGPSVLLLLESEDVRERAHQGVRKEVQKAGLGAEVLDAGIGREADLS